MRKCWILLVVALLLSGCAGAETFETVSDDLLEPVVDMQREIVVTVPPNAGAEVLASEDGGRLYFCDGYTMTVQILDGGDWNRTVQTLCGYSPDALTIMETQNGSWKRQEWVWVSVGEGGDQLGRGAVLDDGNYHYCLTVMSEATEAAALESEWDAVFESFGIA